MPDAKATVARARLPPSTRLFTYESRKRGQSGFSRFLPGSRHRAGKPTLTPFSYRSPERDIGAICAPMVRQVRFDAGSRSTRASPIATSMRPTTKLWVTVSPRIQAASAAPDTGVMKPRLIIVLGR